MTQRRSAIYLFAFVSFLISIPPAVQAKEFVPIEAQAHLASIPLQINTHAGDVLQLSVEVAKTEEEQETGLMFRKQLNDNEGMLFVYQEPRKVTMWMRNTLIPLDIIFIDVNNTIMTIRENAVPESLEFIRSNGEVKAVLEVEAGTVASHEITVGDKVIF